MRHRPFLSLLFIFLFSIVATLTASAHHLPPGMEDLDEFEGHASFLAGFNHVLTGPDHLAAALLVGWLAARFTGRVGAALILGSVLAMAGGILLGASGLKLPAMEAAIFASVVLSVVVISFRSVQLLKAGAAVLICFQVWHGNAHALTTSARSAGATYFAGVCAAAGLAMVLALSLAMLAGRRAPGFLSGAQTA